MIRSCIIRIELDRPLEFLFRFDPLPQLSLYGPESSVRLSQRPVERDRPFSIHFCLWGRLRHWSSRIFIQERIAIRQTDVCECIIWVAVRSHLELLDRLLEVFPCPPVPVKPAFQIRLIRLGIGRSSPGYFG